MANLVDLNGPRALTKVNVVDMKKTEIQVTHQEGEHPTQSPEISSTVQITSKEASSSMDSDTNSPLLPGQN